MDEAVERQISELRGSQDAMQKKTFTKWWNSYLRERNKGVDDLLVDVRDGVQVVNLIEIISGEYIGKYNKKPKHKIHKLENQKACLEFLARKNIKTMGIGPEDIEAGNKKLILAFSWILILRYEVQKYGADTNELLKWARDRTLGYRNVDMRNFKESFNDGLAFCALIHKHYPDKLDYEALDMEDDESNLKLAFQVADKEFGVPQLLEAQDMAAGNPDEKSVITYVAKLRQAFSDKTKQLEDEARVAELARIKAEKEEHERVTNEMVADYNARTDALNDWIKVSDDDFVDKVAHEDFGETPEESQEKLNDLNSNFRGLEKPPKKVEKAELAQKYREIEQRRTKEQRDPFDHPFTPSETEENWGRMDKDEKEYEEGLCNRKKELANARDLAAKEKAARDGAFEALNTLLPAFQNRQQHEDETDRLKDEYDGRVSDLADWIVQKKEGFDTQLDTEDFGTTAQETRSKLSELVDFRRHEKPPKYEELLDLDEMYQNIETRRQAERRPPFTYTADSDQLDTDFKQMEKSEQGVYDELIRCLKRMEGMLPILSRFRRIAKRLGSWGEGAQEKSAQDISGKNLMELTAMLNDATLMASELRGQEPVRRNLKTQGTLLAKEDEFCGEVTTTLEKIDALYAPLQTSVTEYQKQIRQEIERLKKLQLAQVEFDKQVLVMGNFVEQALDITEVPLETDTVSAVNILLDQGSKCAAKLEQPVMNGVDIESGSIKVEEWHGLVVKLTTRVEELKSKGKGGAGAVDQKERQYQQHVKQFDDAFGRHMIKVVMNRANKQLTVKEMERILRNCDTAVVDCRSRADTARASYSDLMDVVCAAGEEDIRSHIVTPDIMDRKVAHLEALLENLAGVAKSSPSDVDAKAVQKALTVLVDKESGIVHEDELRERIGSDNAATITLSIPNITKDTASTFDPFPHANVGNNAGYGSSRVPSTRDFKSQSSASPSKSSLSSANTSRTPSRQPSLVVTHKKADKSSAENLPVQSSSQPPSNKIPDGKGGFLEGQQQSRQIEDGVTLYTTQSKSSPVTIKFDVEVDKDATIEFELCLEGSTNIVVVEPKTAALTTGRTIHSFTTACIGIIAQQDPYQATELKMRYSTKLLRGD